MSGLQRRPCAGWPQLVARTRCTADFDRAELTVCNKVTAGDAR
jgi:hypothetical protein